MDDAAATYPLTIDPWVQAITLTVTGGADNRNLGWSMVLSEDGSTIVVGAPHKAAGGARGGATYVFTMPAGGWASTSAPTAQLTVPNGATGDGFGFWMALSADGDTIAAGAPFTPAGGFQRGVVYAFKGVNIGPYHLPLPLVGR